MQITFKDARENRRMTIEQVVAATGLHRRTIKKAEVDCSDMHYSVARILCDLYNISLDHIHIGKVVSANENRFPKVLADKETA